MSDRAVAKQDCEKRLDGSLSEKAPYDSDRHESISAEVRGLEWKCQQAGERLRNSRSAEPSDRRQGKCPDGKASDLAGERGGLLGRDRARSRSPLRFPDSAKCATLVKLSKLAHPEVRVFPSGNPPGWKVNPNQEKKKLWQ